MTLLPLVLYPDPRLRSPTMNVVDVLNPEIQQLIEDMIHTMYSYRALGLAAIQVGRPERIFVLDLEGKTRVFVNPELGSASEEIKADEEGCLSFPGVYTEVSRPTSIMVSALDQDGSEFEYLAHDLEARAILHEYDHLENKLLVDYVHGIKKEFFLKKLKKAKKT